MNNQPTRKNLTPQEAARRMWIRANKTCVTRNFLFNCQRWLDADPQHRVLLNKARRVAREKQPLLSCMPPLPRLTRRTARAFVPQRQRPDAALLAEAARPRAEDEVVHNLLQQDVGDISNKLRQLLVDQPEQARAFGELRTLWQGLRQVHFELLCAGVSLERVPTVHALKTAAAIRELAEYYRAAGLRYRQAQWAAAAAESPPSWEQEAVCPRGELREYLLDDDTTLFLTGDTVVRTHYTPERRTLIVERGELRCLLQTQLGWPFEMQIGKLRVTAQDGLFWLRYTRPEQILVHGFGSGVCMDVPGAPPRYLPEALPPPDSWQLLCDAQGLRSTDRYAEINRHGTLRKGIVKFDRAPLAEVAHTLTRYNARVQFTCDPEIADLEVTARCSPQEPLPVLLLQLLPEAVSYERHSEGTQEHVRLIRAASVSATGAGVRMAAADARA
jgi:ferric-dicitrate binding protein FerR (iron transport regulator)